jgi:hypothetical protein
MRRQSLMMFVCILQVLAALPPESQGAESRSQPSAKHEAYVIYSTILQNHWAMIPKDSKRFFIIDQTYPFGMCLKPDQETLTTVGQAIANYSKMNNKRWTLKPQFQVTTPYELIPKRNANQGLGPDRFPINFSAVGFNKKKTVAVVGVEYGTNGSFVMLIKKGGTWQPPEKYGGLVCGWAA